MKRSSADGSIEAFHPAVCFHREVLTYMRWTAIRRDFLEELQTSPYIQFIEPKKLWRHSQEALGKWLLSQVARYTHGDVDDSSASFFFPTRAMLPPGGTYDEQLIRDISLKCRDSGSPAVVAEIKRLLARFDLSRRCEDAAAEIVAELQSTSPSMYCAPSLRIIDAAEEQSRTASQRRVLGSVAEISVRWPSQTARHKQRGCPPVSIPLAAYRKLEMCYKYFSEKAESDRYPRMDYSTRFGLRGATLVLRYEGCLATGSLQLCADTRLKQHLHASGYHVMDLCASPINAYMGSPRAGSYKTLVSPDDASKNDSSDVDISSLECENVPNYFCSAFPDTDRYFGSLGSALKFDVEAAYKSTDVNPEKKPLLLTLDVPYDEDLCEQLFLKLVRDLQCVQAKMKDESPSLPYIVDYILVLPLWWNVPMQRNKVLFASSADGAPPPSSDEEKVFMDGLVKERSSMLHNGYTVSYEWPQRLGEMAGEHWVCFDGIFVGDSYKYFCTATNKWLHGVTATEVIGLAQPREKREGDPSLETLLTSFYGHK